MEGIGGILAVGGLAGITIGLFFGFAYGYCYGRRDAEAEKSVGLRALRKAGAL